MKLVKQWKGVGGYMLRDPNRFFAAYGETHGIGYPLQFLLLTFAVAMAPLAILVVVFNVTSPMDVVVGLVLLAVLGLVFWLLTVLEALLAHMIAYLFGARGVVTTLEAYAFPSVVRWGLWWVPFVNIGLGLYGWYLQIKGLSAFHDISTGKSALAALVAILVMNLPTLVILAAVIAAFVLDLGSTGGGM